MELQLTHPRTYHQLSQQLTPAQDLLPPQPLLSALHPWLWYNHYNLHPYISIPLSITKGHIRSTTWQLLLLPLPLRLLTIITSNIITLFWIRITASACFTKISKILQLCVTTAVGLYPINNLLRGVLKRKNCSQTNIAVTLWALKLGLVTKAEKYFTGEGSAIFEKLEKPVRRTKGRQLNKFKECHLL